eukprot:g6100.t1
MTRDNESVSTMITRTPDVATQENNRTDRIGHDANDRNGMQRHNSFLRYSPHSTSIATREDSTTQDVILKVREAMQVRLAYADWNSLNFRQLRSELLWMLDLCEDDIDRSVFAELLLEEISEFIDNDATEATF